MPNFLNFYKIIKEDGTYDIKPAFSLTLEEKKKAKDPEDNSVTFYKQKITRFILGNVFDARDTSMPMDVIDAELNPVLNYKNADEIINCFIKTIYNDGFKVEFNDLTDKAIKGYCDHNDHKIVIRKDINKPMQLKVLIHEYAHALAHKNLENNHLDYKEHRNKYETEAEAIAYSVAKYLGMDTSGYSLNYLYSWSKEKDFKEIDDSLNIIVNYSKKIIKNFEKFYEREYGLYAEEIKALGGI